MAWTPSMACARGFSALDQQPVAPRQLKDLRPATRQTPTWRCRVVIRCHCDSPLEASVRGTTFQSFSYPFLLDVILSPRIMRARTQTKVPTTPTTHLHTTTTQPVEFCAQQCTRISEKQNGTHLIDPRTKCIYQPRIRLLTCRAWKTRAGSAAAERRITAPRA